jgi:hypothetical protein
MNTNTPLHTNGRNVSVQTVVARLDQWTIAVKKWLGANAPESEYRASDVRERTAWHLGYLAALDDVRCAVRQLVAVT